MIKHDKRILFDFKMFISLDFHHRCQRITDLACGCLGHSDKRFVPQNRLLCASTLSQNAFVQDFLQKRHLEVLNTKLSRETSVKTCKVKLCEFFAV